MELKNEDGLTEKEFLAQYRPGNYERPSVTVDMLIFAVDPEAEEEDEVTLIGRDGGEQISVEELARLGGGFHYELICDLGKRVPRVYLQGGRIAGTKDYFQDVYEGFRRP